MPGQIRQNQWAKGVPFKKIKKLSTTADQSQPQTVMVSTPEAPTNIDYIHIYSHNVSGIKNEVGNINGTITNNNYHVIAFQETWFDLSIPSNSLVTGLDFTEYRRDRAEFKLSHMIHGGVSTIVHNQFTSEHINIINRGTIEHIITKIDVGTTSVVLVNVYLPVRTGKHTALTEFNTIINTLNAHYPNDMIIAVGDFNLPELKWEPTEDVVGALTPSHITLTPNAKTFCEIIAQQKLWQVNPFTNSRGTFLDLILTNKPSDVTVHEVPVELILHRTSIAHNPFSFFVKCASKYEEEAPRKRDYRMTKLSAVRSIVFASIPEFDQDEIAYATGICERPIMSKIVRTFDFIKAIIDRHTPYMKTDMNKSKHPWLRNNTEYLAAKAEAKKAYNQWKDDPNMITKRGYSSSMSKCNRIFIRDREAFYQTIISVTTPSVRNFYNLMRIEAKPIVRLPLIMNRGGVSLKGEERFIGLRDELASKFEVSDNPFSMDEEQFQEDIGDVYRGNVPFYPNEIWNAFDFECTTDEIAKIISELNPRKDPGPMEIPASFFKNNLELITPFLTDVMNVIIRLGYIPPAWKNSFIIPIPKKGNLAQVENYRGVAIQAIIPKMIDRLITMKLTKLFDPHITKAQHGFRKGRSIITNLLEVTQRLHENKPKRVQTDIVYIDYSRAFDTIDHRLLAVKMAKLGMPFILYRIIMSFVANRTYQLKIDRQPMELFITPGSGVPQGSHCGPVLFSLYCNDMIEAISDATVSMFADDSKLIKDIKSEDDVRALQRALNQLERWATRNKLIINVSKTYMMSYNDRGFNTSYHLNHEKLKRVHQIRDLGVIFDSELTFRHHLEQLSLKVRRMMGAAKRFVRRLKSGQLMPRVYTTFILPHCEFASAVWDQNQIGMINPIMISQMKMSQIATQHLRASDHRFRNFNYRLAEIQMLSLKDRREMQLAIFMVQTIRGIQHSPLADQANLYRASGIVATRNPNLFNNNSEVPFLSPLARGMRALERFKIQIDRLNTEVTIDTIKARIKRGLMLEYRR